MIESLAIFMAVVAGFLMTLVVLAFPLEWLARRSERVAEALDRIVRAVL